MAADDFNDAEHPRNDDGTFAETAGSGKQDITKLLGKEYRGVKGQAAVDLLLKEKNGYVKGAFHRSEIGDIDLVWGKGGEDGFGLQHIIERRRDKKQDIRDLLSTLPVVIKQGHVKKYLVEGKGNRWIISYGDKRAVISPNLRGNKMNFVLTAFLND
jgi:hypothetical protein